MLHAAFLAKPRPRVSVLKGTSSKDRSAVVVSFGAGLLYSYLLNCVPTELVKDLAKTVFFFSSLPLPQTCFCYVLAC